MRINLGLLPVSDFAPALFVICIASDVDVLSTLRNIIPAFFAMLHIATIFDRLKPGLALFVFFEPALNLLWRRLWNEAGPRAVPLCASRTQILEHSPRATFKSALGIQNTKKLDQYGH